MPREFTIAEARNHLSEVVRLAEDEGSVELTRRGKSVAVVVSLEEYSRLSSAPRRPFAFLEALREQYDAERNGLEPGDFADLRDTGTGRTVQL